MPILKNIWAWLAQVEAQVLPKNWLFFQTVGGGKTAAILMSLIQTAKATAVNVQLYLRDVLQRIATESDVKKLLPHAWKAHFEPEVMKRRNEIVGTAEFKLARAGSAGGVKARSTWA